MVEKSPIFLDIGTGFLTGTPVASAVILSTTAAVCNIYRPVHVGLALTDPTAVARASERRLSWSVVILTVGVTRLRRVQNIKRLDRNPSLGGFVVNLCVELGRIRATAGSFTRRSQCRPIAVWLKTAAGRGG